MPEVTNDDGIDWVKKGAVNPIKNYGKCGADWAFGAAAAMESAHFIATNELLSLSEQQFIDCATDAKGCDGGVEVDAMFYAIQNPVAEDKDYPYIGKAGTCNDSQGGKVHTYRVKTLQSAYVPAMKRGIMGGPINLTVRADNIVFQAYTGGILDSKDCGDIMPNLAVVAVGYGTENGQEYYLIRNAWGTDWGEDGYIRIAIEEGSGICATNLLPLYVLTESP